MNVVAMNGCLPLCLPLRSMTRKSFTFSLVPIDRCNHFVCEHINHIRMWKKPRLMCVVVQIVGHCCRIEPNRIRTNSHMFAQRSITSVLLGECWMQNICSKCMVLCANAAPHLMHRCNVIFRWLFAVILNCGYRKSDWIYICCILRYSAYALNVLAAL